MKTIKLNQPTLLNYETAQMIHELEIEFRRCTHGVARQGRLWKVTDYDYQTGKFTSSITTATVRPGTRPKLLATSPDCFGIVSRGRQTPTRQVTLIIDSTNNYEKHSIQNSILRRSSQPENLERHSDSSQHRYPSGSERLHESTSRRLRRLRRLPYRRVPCLIQLAK